MCGVISALRKLILEIIISNYNSQNIKVSYFFRVSKRMDQVIPNSLYQSHMGQLCMHSLLLKTYVYNGSCDLGIYLEGRDSHMSHLLTYWQDLT